MRDVDHMRWWGWGRSSGEFDPIARPYLLPFLREALGHEGKNVSSVPDLSSLRLPKPVIEQGFLEKVKQVLGSDRVTSEDHERVIHAYGKGYRDLWRLRHAQVDDAPDAVLYPKSEEEVKALVAAAVLTNVALIPFGGGSNISGCLEVRRRTSAMVASVDLGLMNEVLEIDADSGIARVQAGILGPALEQRLNQAGFTFGHFPDSFLHSTLGGWVATRSAGMLSDTYGNIEALVVSLRMISPLGVFATNCVPRSSAGPESKQFILGSEGTLGIITEVTIRIRPIAKVRRFEGWLFPDFEAGLDAMHRCQVSGDVPLLARLNDKGRTRLSVAFRSRAKLSSRLLQASYLGWLSRFRGFRVEGACLMIVGFEGTNRQVRDKRRRLGSLYRACGAVPLGTGPGRSFEKAKYDFPYVRDFLMDQGVLGDVSETSTLWSKAMPLYRETVAAISTAIAETGSRAFVGCHASHTYREGVSLYFTFGCVHRDDDPLGQYLHIKKAAQDAMLAGGGTLSHHHAVGTEHLPWFESDVGSTTVHALEGLRNALDPTGIMNPGKLDRTGNLAEWGYSKPYTLVAASPTGQMEAANV